MHFLDTLYMVSNNVLSVERIAESRSASGAREKWWVQILEFDGYVYALLDLEPTHKVFALAPHQHQKRRTPQAFFRDEAACVHHGIACEKAPPIEV